MHTSEDGAEDRDTILDAVEGESRAAGEVVGRNGARTESIVWGGVGDRARARTRMADLLSAEGHFAFG